MLRLFLVLCLLTLLMAFPHSTSAMIPHQTSMSCNSILIAAIPFLMGLLFLMELLFLMRFSTPSSPILYVPIGLLTPVLHVPALPTLNTSPPTNPAPQHYRGQWRFPSRQRFWPTFPQRYHTRQSLCHTSDSNFLWCNYLLLWFALPTPSLQPPFRAPCNLRQLHCHLP